MNKLSSKPLIFAKLSDTPTTGQSGTSASASTHGLGKLSIKNPTFRVAVLGKRGTELSVLAFLTPTPTHDYTFTYREFRNSLKCTVSASLGAINCLNLAQEHARLFLTLYCLSVEGACTIYTELPHRLQSIHGYSIPLDALGYASHAKTVRHRMEQFANGNKGAAED